MKITEEQFRHIAKIGFYYIEESVSIDTLGFFVLNDVYRLYDIGYGFIGRLPHRTILSLSVSVGSLQFGSGHLYFNQLSAIREMAELGLIKLHKS